MERWDPTHYQALLADIGDADGRAEEALRLSEERLRLATVAARIGIVDYDAVTGRQLWSPMLCDIFGIGEDVPHTSETYFSLIHPDERAESVAYFDQVLRSEHCADYSTVRRIVRPVDGGVRWVQTEGNVVRDGAGRMSRIIVAVRDVTEQKSAQDRIEWAASHDPLTGLLNRSAFQARLKAEIADAKAGGRSMALMLFDLDNFKFLNDTLGHQAGDRALILFAERLTEAAPGAAAIARFGGDEFALILSCADGERCTAVGRTILSALQPPFVVDGRQIDGRASIGVALFPMHGDDAASLVQSADIALYGAKADGRATMRMFESAMRAGLQREVSMRRQARAALDHDWIEPFYQPKVMLAGEGPGGYEALLRWRHPSAGLQLPGTIAAAFDDVETAEAIGAYMTEAVLADVRRWLDEGFDPGIVAINASPAEFRQPGYAARLIGAAARHCVPPASIQVEITETALLSGRTELVRAELDALRAVGFTIAMDDFGTGFSSLAHLRNFPVDVIKIDRSFVAGIEKSESDAAIIEAVLRLGQALGLQTVAEGVETEAQAEFLRARGCTMAQGWLYAKPVPAGDVAGRLH